MWSPVPRIAGVTFYDPRADLSIQPLFGAPGNRMGRLGAFVLVVQKSKGGMADSGVPRDKYKFEPNRKYQVRVSARQDPTFGDRQRGARPDGDRRGRRSPGADAQQFLGRGRRPDLFRRHRGPRPGGGDRRAETARPVRGVVRRTCSSGNSWPSRSTRLPTCPPSDKQFLKAQLSTLTENPARIVAAVARAAYRPDLPQSEAVVALRQAIVAAQLDPSNGTALFLRGLAAYRAGRFAEAEATMRECQESLPQERGSAAPWPLAVLALVAQKANRPQEARTRLRQAKDLLADDGWVASPNRTRSDETSRRGGGGRRPPPDPDGDAIRKLVFSTEVNGWGRGGPGGVPLRVRRRRPGDRRPGSRPRPTRT